MSNIKERKKKKKKIKGGENHIKAKGKNARTPLQKKNTKQRAQSWDGC